MKREANSALLEELRKLGRPTTPDELRSRGVRAVVSIGSREISILIERAINRTLMERTIGPLDPGELRTLVDGAQAEFTSQVHDLRDLAESRNVLGHLRHAVEGELAEVRDALAVRREGTQDKSSVETFPVDPVRWDKLRLQMQARLLPLYDYATAGAPPLRRVVAGLLELFAAERAKSLELLREETDDEIDRLERRVSKLIESLERSEQLIARVSAMKNIDTGIASIYREIQGVDPFAADRENRMSLMESIFRANVELRRTCEAV